MKNYSNLAALLIFAVLAACSQKQHAPSSKIEVTTQVGITEVRFLRPEKKIIIPGELDPYFSSDIYPRIKGFIKTLYVDRGTQVSKGEVLTRVDAPELTSELNDAKARLSQTQANLIGSKETYNRMVETSKTPGAIAPNELSVAKARMDGDKASVAGATAVVEDKTKMVQYLTIRAPFDGTITVRNISVGDLVGPDESSKSKAMFSLQENKHLRLVVAVPETYTGELQKNEEVSFMVTAMPEKKFTARLSRSSGSLDVSTRTMLVEFDVTNVAGLLKSGMYAEVLLPIERKVMTPFVPKESVLSSSEGTYVIRANNRKAERVTIKKGMSLDSLVEVFGNIHEGDKVVHTASDDIKDGDELNVKL